MIWLVLLAFSCVYGQEEVPKILVDASNFHGFPESFSFLSVQTNNVNGAKYHWLKDGKKITKDSRPTFFQPFQTRLLVANAGKEYAGTYQFVMNAPAGTITGRKIKVEFTYVGEFDATLPTDYTPQVVVGQANFIKCPKHSPGSNVIYKWGKSSKISGTKFMDSKPNYIVLDDGTLFYSHLTVDNVKHFNENEWTCGMEAKVKETSQFMWADGITTKLTVADTNLTDFGPKIVTTLPENKQFGEGETISMKCAAAGKPTPTYSWKRIDVYGKEFPVRDGEYGITFDDGDARLLVVKNALRKHAGRYFCTATIGDKNDTVKGSLTFQVKPSWIGEMINSVKPSIFSSHSWTCNATGFPMPTYKWYKNGNPLNSSAKHNIDGGTLTFPRLEKTDTGMYECVAHNTVDNIYQTAYLDVQAEKPVFDTNTGKKTLFLGAKGTIECHAKAAPAAVNTWSKDGVDIDFASLSRYTLVNNEDLMIDSVSKQDIGNYTCRAKNLYGEDIKKISVQVVGEITFVEEPKDVVTTRGSQIKLKCRAEGDKESPIKATIKYKWKYNDRDIELNDTIVWSDSAHSLVFLKTQVSQSGIYECIAYIDQPSYAEKKRQAKVVVRGPPEAPNKVKIDGDCSLFSAKLMWHITNNNYEPIKYFIIQMATSYNTQWHNVSDKVSATKDEKTIKNLSPWTRYRFRVLAINEIGTSAPSEPTLFDDCETPEREPTICPKMEVIPGKRNELTVKWKKIELIDQNGKNFNYRMEYSSSETTFSGTKIFKPYELTFQVPNAGYYRPWKFKIQGFNDVGGGPFCENDTFSGQDAPTKAPTELRVTKFGDVSLVLEWKEIILEKGSVDGYKLTYWHTSTSSKTRRSISGEACDEKNPCELDVGSGRTAVEIQGLIPFTQYRIAVRGYNSGGLGPAASISARTSQGKPSAPSAVELTAYAKFIKLEWREPKRPNGIITGYSVSIDNDAKPRPVFVDGAVRKYVFGGLEPSKEYIVYIQAKTKTGFGEKIATTVTTKSLQIPAKPEVPVLNGIGKDGVNVTFNEGEPEKGFPERFFVVYRVKGAKNDTWMKTKPVDLFRQDSKPYLEINGLDKTKEYEMATIAVNEEGESSKSDIATVTPGNIEGNAPQVRSSPVYKRSWFVAIVVIVCFLLILLLVALLITRKRGERYPVGKREKRRAGILDVGEEPDVGLYPMKPPRQNGNGVNRQDSGGSIPNRDPDRDSLDEYGEDRFDEDTGSLIGAYNDDRKHNKAIEEPEFV